MSLELHYDFANQPNLDSKDSLGPTLDITRTTTSTFRDQDGLIRTAQAGEARFTGARRVENHCPQSNNLSTTWTNTRSVDTQNVGTDPFGGSTAQQILDDAGGSASTVVMKQTSITVGQGVNTFSVYAKMNSVIDWVALRTASFDNDPGISFFDLDNGVVGTKDALHSAYGIEDAGDGWFRCWVAFAAVTDQSGQVEIYLSDGDGDTSVARAGASSILVYGVQIETTAGQQDPAPSEYQGTTTVAVAKAYVTKRRTNLLLQSENFGTTWSNNRTTDVQAVETAPDGTLTANSLNEDGTGASDHRIEITPGLLTFGAKHTFSGYFKASERDWVGLSIKDSGGASSIGYFNIANGTVGTLGGGIDGSIESAQNTYPNTPDGWFRCSITITNGSGASPSERCRIWLAEGDNDKTFSGLTQETILCWGMQLEISSSVTDYIATTTTVASSSFDTSITATGLLVEEARTNICLSSELFTDADWTETNTDQPTTNNTAPDGTATADEIASTSTADQAFAIYQAFTGRTATEVTTLSCYLKAGTNATFAQLAWDDAGGGADGCFCNFKLSDGTKGTVTALAAGVATSASIESVGNGWYRCTIVGSIAVGTTGRFTVSIIDIISAAVFEAANLANNDSIIAWGADIEIGAFPTSHIKTVGSAVTRNADVDSTTTVSAINANVGTWYVKGSFPHASTAARKILTLDDGGTTDRIFFELDASENINFSTTHSADTNGASDGAAVVAVNTSFDVAAAYADDDIIAYVDGTSSGADTSAAFPLADAMTTLRIGSDSAGNYFNGHIAEIRYYNTRSLNAVVENMSNGLFGEITNIVNPRDAMPLDNTNFHNFISDVGGSTGGGLNTEYKNALGFTLGLTESQIHDRSINDLFKEYFESL